MYGHLPKHSDGLFCILIVIVQLGSLWQLSKEAISATNRQAPTSISSAVKVSSTPSLNYVTLDSFSWEQESDKLKVKICLSIFVAYVTCTLKFLLSA